MSIRAKMIKQAAREQRTATRNLTRYIGNRMLRAILDDIGALDSESRDLVEASDLQERLYYTNPTYIYEEYGHHFTSGLSASDGMTEFQRGVRSSIYKSAQVFDAVKYASQKVVGNKFANSLLESIFKPTVVNNVLFAASYRLYVYDEVRRKSSSSILQKVAEKVYYDREKYITGMSIRGMSVVKKNIPGKFEEDAIYFEMQSKFVSSGRDVGYFNRLMDLGAYTRDEVPTLKQIYGWLKRREAEGKFRPLVVVAWRRRNKRVGSAAKFLSHPPKTMLIKKPYEAAPIIASRLARRFAKRGRLSPFGSFAKYRSGKIFDETIFTEIFQRFLKRYTSRVDREAPEITGRVVRTLKLRLGKAIEAGKGGKPEAKKLLDSLNRYIRNKGIVSVVHDGDIVPIKTSGYSLNELRRITNLGMRLGVINMRRVIRIR